MGIKTFEYESDDSTKYLIRMSAEYGIAVGNIPYSAGTGVQPEKIVDSADSKPIDCRYIWGEIIDEGTPSQGDTYPKRKKVIICNPKNNLFLNGGDFSTSIFRFRITGAVGEKRTFFGD